MTSTAASERSRWGNCTVKAIEVDGLIARVNVEDLALRRGDQVQALVKATSVMIMK